MADSVKNQKSCLNEWNVNDGVLWSCFASDEKGLSLASNEAASSPWLRPHQNILVSGLTSLGLLKRTISEALEQTHTHRGRHPSLRAFTHRLSHQLLACCTKTTGQIFTKMCGGGGQLKVHV